jgi:hypothetical protein
MQTYENYKLGDTKKARKATKGKDSEGKVNLSLREGSRGEDASTLHEQQ